MVWTPDHIWYAQKKGKGKGFGGGGGGNDVMKMLMKMMMDGGSGKGWGKSKGARKQMSSSGDFKEELISKIKAFQRSSEEKKQMWWAFCDSTEGGNRDPARHEADVLKAFLAEHGIQVVQSNNFDKVELISKIKDFQRSSEEQKQAWWAFCDSTEGGNRDPTRHDADVLKAFLAGKGIQVSEGNNFVKAELINKIKEFQRSSEEQKQAWWTFCDTQEGQKRDPALYEVDVLQNFLAQYDIHGVQGNKEQKSMLVAKIKSFQKSGDDQKQTWWSYCDSQAGKKRDPALYDVNFLEAFVNENGI